MFETLKKAFKKEDFEVPEGFQAPKELRLYNHRTNVKIINFVCLLAIAVDLIVGYLHKNGFHFPESFYLADIPAYFYGGWCIVSIILVFLIATGTSGNLIVGLIGGGLYVFGWTWLESKIMEMSWYIRLKRFSVPGISEDAASLVCYCIMFLGLLFIHSFFLISSLKKIDKYYDKAKKQYTDILNDIEYMNQREQAAKEEERKYEEFKRNEERRRYEEYRRQEEETRRRYEQQHQQEQRWSYEKQRNTESSKQTNSGIDFFAGCNSKEDVEKKYKKLASIYHPDTGFGDEETMKLINNQKEEALKRFS